MLVKNHILKVEIADTPSRHQRGLMFRDKLDFDGGMLFIFEKPQVLSFWGQNTYVPLDIAFIDEDSRITKIAHIPRLSERLISSDKSCLMALETNIGYFHQYHIKAGHSIKINPYNKKIATVTFQEIR